MRALDGSGELAVPAYELFSDTEILGRMAMERMLAGLSTRRYPVGLEPVGARTEQAATATSKSAVSRRFVAATETALAALLGADLAGLDLVALMVDGVHFGEHCAVVALGIDIDGVKHPLSLVEGSTENATLVSELLVGLRERGLDVTRPILTVLDGSKALRRAVLEVFDHPVIARCQLHKLRNVQDRLPQKLRSVVAKRMRAAYHAETTLGAQAELETEDCGISRPAADRRAAGGRPAALAAADGLGLGDSRQARQEPLDGRAAGPQAAGRGQGPGSAGGCVRGDDPGLSQVDRHARQGLGIRPARAPGFAPPFKHPHPGFLHRGRPRGAAGDRVQDPLWMSLPPPRWGRVGVGVFPPRIPPTQPPPQGGEECAP